MVSASLSVRSLPLLALPAPLSEVWASKVPIRLMWRANSGLADLSTVENRLRQFNDRLYDCTDGQWRVGRFLIHDDRSELSPTGQGVGSTI